MDIDSGLLLMRMVVRQEKRRFAIGLMHITAVAGGRNISRLIHRR